MAAHAPVPDRLQAARRIAATSWPYLATAIYRLVPRPAKHERLTSLAVDKYWRLYYDPDWVESAPLGVIATRIAGHELWHLLNRHFARTDQNRPDIVNNITQDCAINSTIKQFAEAGVQFRRQTGKVAVTLSADAPGDEGIYPEKIPKQFGGPFPPNLLYEEYLALFKDPPTVTIEIHVCGSGGGKPPPSCGSGATGTPAPWDEPAPGDPDKTPNGVSAGEAKVIIKATADQVREFAAKHPGLTPGGLERWAEFVLAPPKVRWQSLLKAQVRRLYHYVSGQTDTTYSRRNSRTTSRRRRQASGRHGFILPGTRTPKPRVCAVLDTSGSMTVKDYRLALAEVLGVIKSLGASGIELLCVDTHASEFRLVKDPSRILLEGGGGTDMGVGLAKAYEDGFQLVVLLSDGYTPYSKNRPPKGTKVIICLTQPPNPNYPTPDWATVVCVADNE